MSNIKPNLETAVMLSRLLWEKLEPLNLFPALAGGTLYKNGDRKDIDICICSFNSDKDALTHEVAEAVLSDELTELGFAICSYHGAVAKTIYKGLVHVDILFPQLDDYDYDQTRQAQSKFNAVTKIGIHPPHLVESDTGL